MIRLTNTGQLQDGSWPVVHPTDFKEIWNDAGSGARRDGSVWRPEHSSGNYVALSDFAHASHSKPSTNDTIMVHKSFVSPAYIGDNPIWKDTGSGARKDFSAWPILCNQDTQLKTGDSAFVGSGSHSKPGSTVHCLNLNLTQPLNVLVPVPTGRAPSASVLVSRQYIPFYVVNDRVVSSDSMKVSGGMCWYVLEVYNAWTEISRVVNDKSSEISKEYALTYGVSQTESETFSREAGIALSVSQEVSVGGKIKAVDVSSTTTVTVSGHYTIGRTSSTSQTVLRQGTHTISMQVAPRTTDVIYQLKATAKLKRASNGVVIKQMDIPTQSYRVVTV
jgi:hypothetical protein